VLSDFLRYSQLLREMGIESTFTYLNAPNLVDISRTPCFEVLLSDLINRRDLRREQVRWFMEEVMSNRCPEPEAAALLIALRMKGETAGEIAAAAEVLRERMIPLDTREAEVIDTCGTGGDERGTFNISTATALVVAGTGLPVVKHGNRAVSSRIGSADVLAALGVSIDGTCATARRSLADAGLAFCFAPHFHPALKHVAGLRRRLGVRTLFNCLGPLANPGGAPYQLLGVGRPELQVPLAGALAILGVRRALVVSGLDGLDEVSLSGPTRVLEVSGPTVRELEWRPADFQLETCSLSDISAGSPEESAALIRGVLAGEEGPPTWVVLANAAAALYTAGRVNSIVAGVARARAAIRSGQAGLVLERLVAYSREKTTPEAQGERPNQYNNEDPLPGRP
jgi:anthranilate phosphoribosyltransferase